MNFNHMHMLLSVCLWYAALFTCAFGLTVISVVLGGSEPYRYEITAPTYEIAFSDAVATFPGLLNGTARKGIYRSGYTINCDEEVQVLHEKLGEILQLFSNMEGPTILQTPGCTGVAITLGDFARELNAPLIIGTAGGPMFLDKSRFPTVFTFSMTDHGSVSDAAVAMLRLYNWTTVSLLCGDLNSAVTIYTITACRTHEARLRQASHTYDVYRIPYDHVRTETYETVLKQIRSQSRVIFLFCDSDYIQPMMATAYTLGMTAGDYIFLSPQGYLMKSRFDPPWDSDPVTRNFSKSLIIYTNEPPDWTYYAETSRKISRLAKDRYGADLSSDNLQVNSLNFAAYEGFLSLVQAFRELNELHTRANLTAPGQITTAALIKQSCNRIFHLKSGDIYINAVGSRRANVQFMRLEDSTFNYKVGRFYDVVGSSGLIIHSDMADMWVSGVPKNKPLCGYRLDECQEADSSVAIAAAVASALAAIVIGFPVAIIVFQYGKKRGLWGAPPMQTLDASSLKLITNKPPGSRCNLGHRRHDQEKRRSFMDLPTPLLQALARMSRQRHAEV